MQARNFKYLSQVPRQQLPPIVAQGLQLLAENSASLMEDAQACHRAGRPRGAALLSAYATEEAAKAMMLLDLARASWQDLSMLRSMTSHLARLLYVWSYDGSPADLDEVHRYVDELRRDQVFLEDLPVVSPNPLLQEREEIPYVDYVLTYEEARALKGANNGTSPALTEVLGRWTSPSEVWLPDALREELYVPPIVKLLPLLELAGCLTAEGLTAIASVWRQHGAVFAADPHHRTLVELNAAVLRALAKAGVLSEELVNDDVVVGIVQGWSFPLTGADLSTKKVSDEEIDAMFHRWAVAEGLVGPDDA